MLYKYRDKDFLILMGSLFFCQSLYCQPNNLPPIQGGPTVTPSSTKSIAAQIISGDFQNKPELLFTTWKTATDSAMCSMWMPQGQPSISRTQKNKSLIPPAAASVFQQTSGSFLRTRVHLNHPSGETLFPNNSQLAGLLDAFLTSCKTADNNPPANKGYMAILYFSQFHLNVLHELYEYLISIYATMNLTHYGVYSNAYLDYIEQNRQAPDPTSTIAQKMWKVSPIEDYTTKEDVYALNKKILIINHLITIIEAQSNKAILARFPTMPQHLATRAGMTMMKFDYGARLELLIDKQEIAFITAINPNLNSQENQASGAVITSMRTKYLALFSDYLTLFRNYTKSLTQGTTGVSTFVEEAQTIRTILEKTAPQVTQQSTITQLRALQTINPPLFLYNDEALRGIKLVPTIAQMIPKNSLQVPLPQKIISEANAGTMLPFGNNPVAFYGDDETGTKQLYINIPTAQGIFSQKLLPQPLWLNSTDGVIAMLRACLGDFSALLDDIFSQESILDPCLTCIVSNAAGMSTSSSCNDCSLYLNTMRNFIAQNQSDQTNNTINIPSTDSPGSGNNELPNIGSSP